MSTPGTFATFTAKGGQRSGVLALPEGSDKAPAVVLIHEWWGINDHIRSLTDRMAAEGFVVFAPDLFHGKVAREAEEATRLMQGLDWPQAMDDIAGAARFAVAHPRSNGKVGVMGFCLGGALTFAAATHIGEFSAAVPFYGVPDEKFADYAKVRAPILAHFARRDDWAKPAMAEAIKKRLDARGHSMELCLYDADHAFVNDTRPEVHDPEAAKLAWRRTVEFFHKHLH